MGELKASYSRNRSDRVISALVVGPKSVASASDCCCNLEDSPVISAMDLDLQPFFTVEADKLDFDGIEVPLHGGVHEVAPDQVRVPGCLQRLKDRRELRVQLGSLCPPSSSAPPAAARAKDCPKKEVREFSWHNRQDRVCPQPQGSDVGACQSFPDMHRAGDRSENSDRALDLLPAVPR